jgi:formate dehydrogenase subunit beta
VKGAKIGTKQGIDDALTPLLREALQAGVAEAVLIPVETPAGDSFAHVAIRDGAVLDRARVLPPVMPSQGAKALASIAVAVRGRNVIAVMRPCEVRAAVELAKLDQLDVSRITFVSIDCPGAVPLKQYVADRERAPDWADDSQIRPVCRSCINFAATGDLHVATLGNNQDACLLLPMTEKGQALIDALGLHAEEDGVAWEAEVGKRTEERVKSRETENQRIAAEVAGVKGLAEFFARCIGCHNCRNVCPICYCRTCYIDGAEWEVPAERYVDRARAAGGLRLPPDTVLFHVGRMAHMSLSCVSCGACEDACPADIRIAQLFSMVGDETRKLFEYRPGTNAAEPVPLATYQEDELHAYES